MNISLSPFYPLAVRLVMNPSQAAVSYRSYRRQHKHDPFEKTGHFPPRVIFLAKKGESNKNDFPHFLIVFFFSFSADKKGD